jgi:hypothetical protein
MVCGFCQKKKDHTFQHGLLVILFEMDLFNCIHVLDKFENLG